MDSLSRHVTPEYVGERLKLAAETDRKMPRVGPASVKSAHPATLALAGDAFLFGENWRENLKLKIEQTTRIAPNRESLKMMDEAMGWLRLIDGAERRRALWCWACGVPDWAIASKIGRIKRRTIGYWRETDLKKIAEMLSR